MERFLLQLEGILDETMHMAECLSFGDGVDHDNILGKWVPYTTNAVADTEDELTHNLGTVPVCLFIMKPPASGTINLGPTPWTTSKAYLKCSAASQTALIFFMLQGHEDAE
jgi:hypothetical protein